MFFLKALLRFDSQNLPAWTLFVCLFVPHENFSLIWRRHHYRWRAANFDLYLVFMAIEQWGFFNVPHLLWHRPTIYNAHLRGSVTLMPFAKRFGSWAITTVLTTFKSILTEVRTHISHIRGERFITKPLRRCMNLKTVISFRTIVNQICA